MSYRRNDGPYGPGGKSFRLRGPNTVTRREAEAVKWYRATPEDRLKLFESVVVQVQMTSSWHVCCELILGMGSGVSGSDAWRFSMIGAVVAMILLFVEVCL